MNRDNTNGDKDDESRFILGYENFLQRAEQTLVSTTRRTEGALKHALEVAREKAVELGELTQEEAEKIHGFVTRDLHSAGEHLAEKERAITDWLHLGVLVVEKALLNRFTALSQAAKLELVHLKKAKQRLDEWHTGEITTIGTLCCTNCGKQIHFEHVGRIPPCPECHATVFKRVRT